MQKWRDDKRAKAVANGNNFEAVNRDWWAHWQHTSLSQQHIHQTMRRLEADVFPVIDTRPVAKIEASEVLHIALAIEKREGRGVSQAFFADVQHGISVRHHPR